MIMEPSLLEILTVRDVNASIAYVFKAWSDPFHLRNWWGPRGFTNTFNDFDFKPGGRWSFVMHGPDGGKYVNEAVFSAIEAPTYIAFDHISPPEFRIEARFEPLTDSSTRISFKMIFKTAAERDKLIGIVPEKNEENFDRLEEELLKMKQEGQEAGWEPIDPA
ncbi:MAG: ATPase [Chitinophagaceae bacterium]|nr:MAG: ATPase [Chitinophagaceae bacterium]